VREHVYMKPKVYKVNQFNGSSPVSMNTMKEADVTRFDRKKNRSSNHTRSYLKVLIHQA
jgi:hypothetical protein